MMVSEYRQKVRRTLGLAGNDTAALPDVDVLEALNDGLKAIASEQEWAWLRTMATGTLTAGLNTLAVPAGYLQTIYFEVADRPVLEQRPSREIADEDETEEGYPVAFALEGDNFVLWPTPSEAFDYRHFYHATEPVLAGDSDEPLLPDAFSPWLVAEAAVRLPLRTNSPAKYEVLQEEIAGWRRRALADLKRERNAAPLSIRRTKSVWPKVW